MFKKLLFLVAIIGLSLSVKGQASWEQFGQNRVQYRTFQWKYYDSTHFRTFYYDNSKANALYALNIAEQELAHIVYMMGGRLNKKLNIIIYNSFGDFRQTNLGRKNDEFNQAAGGKVDVTGDNIPVYFNGDHDFLKKQIRKGICSVIKNNMLFGDNIKEVVKNAVKMNLPEWYTLGYVEYISDEWTPEKESEIKNTILQKAKPNFSDLATLNPTLYGHSFWNFVANKYGENYISNLLYLTRYRKSVNNALETVLKKPSKEIYKEWQVFYTDVIDSAALAKDSLDGRTFFASIKTKPDAEYSQFATSPTGREIGYVEKKDGQFTVYIYDVKYGKTFSIVDGGVRGLQELADIDYPMLCWSPSGRKLAVLYQRKNNLNLRIFTSGKRKMENRYIPARKIDRITGMCFMGDENSLAVTAIKKGQSDLYKLTIRNNRFENITNDLFDDKEPSFVQNGTATGILFLSNRMSNYIGENSKSDAFNQTFNLFLYQPQKGNNLTQLSNTSSTIFHPIQWGLEQFSYIQNEQGKRVRKIVSIEKRGTEPDTFSVRNAKPTHFTILDQDYIHQNAHVVEVIKQKKLFTLFNTSQQTMKDSDEVYNILHQELIVDSTASVANTNKKDSEYVTPFENADDSSAILETIFSAKTVNSSRYALFTGSQTTVKPTIYKPTFYPDFLQSSLDNTLLFTRYQAFDYSGGQYQNVPLSGFLTSTLTDVMEDYKVMMGARLGIDFRSLDYFLKYEDYRKRVDWGILYFHSASTKQYDQRAAAPPYFSPYLVNGKVGMDYLQSSWTYPFDMLQSIRLQLGMRYDRIRIQAKDKYSIGIPDDQQYWAVSRVEYVYDNSISPLLNIWKGSRAKLFAEYQYKVNSPSKGFYNFGYDARNYVTLYKNLILASRLAGSHSGGNAKILYFLGGVDNPLNAKFDENTTIDLSQNYAFQSLATNLRGYNQGFRNGNSFMVVNEEVRLPIYNTFFKRPIKSSFIRNLQLVAFADIGSAWKGILPNQENIQNLNKVTDPNSGLTVYIDQSRYDFGLGYGLGLRTRLLGYFIRTDFAWNIEGSKKPLVHISLATDF